MLIWMGLKLNQKDKVYFKKVKTQSKIIISNILFSSNNFKNANTVDDGPGKKKTLVGWVRCGKCLQG